MVLVFLPSKRPWFTSCGGSRVERMTNTLITGANNGLGRTTIASLLQQIASGSEHRDG